MATATEVKPAAEYAPLTRAGHNAETVLEVEGLQTYLFTRLGVVKAVDDVSFAIRRAETLAIVGESGCGKTMTALSLLRLVPNPPGRIVSGSIKIDGKDLVALSEPEMRDIRGNEISMIFQEPMTSLNPVMTVGAQISETIRLHEDLSKAAAMDKAVDDVTFAVRRAETLAIVGESGCGKTMTALSLLRLVPSPPGRIVSGSIKIDGKDLVKLSDAEMRDIRGNEISMIFQEPMTSLNPVMTVGHQISETIRLHEDLSKAAAMDKAVEMLRLVRIPEPKQRAKEYPHQLSGGMRQRAMIAMALACNPRVLIADEPTTALDVTIQAQILDLILALQKRLGTAVVLITHDLAVVAETAQRVIVMYAGKKVEEADVEELFGAPLHPYTHGLMASIPQLAVIGGQTAAPVNGRLKEIPGQVPALTNLPPGCSFAPRCAFADERCRSFYPPYEQKRPGHWAACWHSEKLYG